MKRFQSNVATCHERQHAGADEAVPDGRRRAADRRRSSAVTPIEDVLPGAEQEHLEDVVRRMIAPTGETLPHDRRHLLESYRYVHAARKVVGVGSVGARTWILLLIGRDDGDPLFLQFKEAQASVLEPFLGKSRVRQHGQRVVEGQRMMQAASDVLLGWERIITIDGQQRDFYIRQLWDSKGSAEVESMDPGLEAYGRICGWTLAEPMRARATGSRSPPTSGAATPSTGHGVVRRDVRGPERAGLPRAAGGGSLRPRRGRVGRLTLASAEARLAYG